MSERNYEFRVRCVMCKKVHTLKVRHEDYDLFFSQNRPLIQDIFPYLSLAERELLISDICEDCWNTIFGCEDDDDDEGGEDDE